ncbi:BtpA/SgcQ family protein [Carboxylicivirga linearis]|uniref:BtpA/SgcQ family protein n=1 Tax=Carboxylicivirga linearis TaxID=1628157 RepID=A0ABS5JTR1_9BACT|nr:BtpA/SgcQ family protein [Carboxylicivirga linearis]MBS2098180.1 BtpA/SgcQ family protein [Carboxylicivirga linearis]
MNLIRPDKIIVGMIHVDALPGTPNHQLSVCEIARKAALEAKLYHDEGVDAIMIENMHDTPYLNKNADHEITAAMTVIAHEVKNAIRLPVGIQILAGANKQALAVANAVDLDFIRAEGFVFSHIADEGMMNSCAGELLRYRKNIGADKVKILTDIKKKHSSHALTADVSLLETAKAAEFFLSDGVIITGNSTGEAVEPSDLAGLKSEIKLPVIIGSGISNENIYTYWNQADVFVVGSHFKLDGHWTKGVDPGRVQKFMRTVHSLRQ